MFARRSGRCRPRPVLDNQLLCLLDVELFDLLRGHVQLAREHRHHPRFVLNLLLPFDGRGSPDGLAGGERLPKRGGRDLGIEKQRPAFARDRPIGT